MTPLRWLAVSSLGLLLAACPQHSAVRIIGAQAVATPPGATAGAAYLELIATADDELLAVTTPVAERAEIHSSTTSNGMMQMRPVATVALKAGQAVRFAPGGMHLMLMNLRSPLVVDTDFSISLRFKNAGDVQATVHVVPPGS
jgi:copper(I)-binding protein